MFRRTALASGLLIAALALGACAGGSTSPAGSAQANPDGTLTVGLVLEPSTLDIRHSSEAAIQQVMIDNVYQGLVARTPENTVIDALATTHARSDDGLAYTFTLADGVTFHDGAALTSKDVVASFQAVKDDEKITGHADFADVASIEAPDAKTVVITLSKPNQNFLFNLTGTAGLVFKAGDTTDMKTKANGTGPFTLESWKQGDSITFARNKNYWGTPAALSEVTFKYIPDYTSGINAALGNDLDVLTAVDANQAKRFDGTDFTVRTGKTTDKGTLAFNNAKAPLNDPRVREALRLGVDHAALVKALGAGTTMFGPIPQLDPGYEDLSSTMSYDPAKAKQLLAEAGQSNLSLKLTIPSFYGTTVPQVLASDYNKIGVKLDVNSVEFPAWYNDVYVNKNYDLSFVLHVEPRDFGNFTNPAYYFGYNNPKVQELAEQSLRTVDPAASAKILSEAARLVAADSPVDWLYNGATISAVLPSVTGFPVDSLNSRVNLAGVSVTD